MFILTVGLAFGVHAFNVSAMEKDKVNNNYSNYDFNFKNLKLKNEIKEIEKEIINKKNELKKIKTKENKLKKKYIGNLKVIADLKLDFMYGKTGTLNNDEMSKQYNKTAENERKYNEFINGTENKELKEKITKEIEQLKKCLNLKYCKLEKIKRENPQMENIFSTEPEELNSYGYDSDSDCEKMKKKYRTIDDYKTFGVNFKDIYQVAARERALKYINMKKRDILKQYKPGKGSNLLSKEEYNTENKNLKEKINHNKSSLSTILNLKEYDVNKAYVNKNNSFNKKNDYDIIKDYEKGYEKKYDDLYNHMIKKEVLKYEKEMKKKMGRRKILMNEGIDIQKIQDLERLEEGLLKNRYTVYEDDYDRFYHYVNLFKLADERLDLLKSDPRKLISKDDIKYDSYIEEVNYLEKAKNFWLNKMNKFRYERNLNNSRPKEFSSKKYSVKYEKKKENEIKTLKEDEKDLQSMNFDSLSYLSDFINKYEDQMLRYTGEINKMFNYRKDLEELILSDKNNLQNFLGKNKSFSNSNISSSNNHKSSNFVNNEELYNLIWDKIKFFQGKKYKIEQKIMDLKSEIRGEPMTDRLRFILKDEISEKLKELKQKKLINLILKDLNM